MIHVDTVTVKGSPVRSLQQFIENDLTEAQRTTAFATLPPEYAERLRQPVVATEAIPVVMVNRLTEAAAHAKGEPVDLFARRAGRFAAGEAVKGIFRLFALVMTPVALLGRASQIWATVYSQGQLKVEKMSDSGAVLELHDFPTEAVTCARITGWLERMAELTGVKNVRVQHIACTTRGASVCRWEIRWDA